MKILSLNVQNFLRLEALEIVPKGNSVTITGKNDQGKSSTLRAIDAALGGGTAPEDPVHRGANKAEITVALGNEKIEAIVKRTYIKQDNGEDALATLTVSTPDGAKYGKPQKFLNDLLGALSLDPVKFLEMEPEQQAKVVRAFVPDFDFAANELTYKSTFGERTDVNREVKRLEAEVNALPSFPADWPRDLIVTDELVTEIEKATEANSSIEVARSNVDRARGQVLRYQDAVRSQKSEIEDLEARLERARVAMTELTTKAQEALDEATTLEAKLADMKPIDVSQIRTKLEEAEVTNDKVRDFKQAETRRGRLSATLDEQRKKAEDLTAKLESLKDEARVAIGKAKMPVPGLGFDDEGKVTIDSFPLANTSFSKRLLTAIAIAAAHAPTLRLVKIADGDKLDDESQAMLAKFADEHDLQVWMETVQHGEPIGFVIEDGKLKGHANAQD